MFKLKKIYLFYSDFQNQYSMEVEIGNKVRKVSFKMDDAQTRKATRRFWMPSAKPVRWKQES